MASSRREGRLGPGGVLGGVDDGEHGMGERGEQGPASPGGLAADLVVVEPGEAFAGLEGLLHRPAAGGG